MKDFFSGFLVANQVTIFGENKSNLSIQYYFFMETLIFLKAKMYLMISRIYKTADVISGV